VAPIDTVEVDTDFLTGVIETVCMHCQTSTRGATILSAGSRLVYLTWCYSGCVFGDVGCERRSTSPNE
jgi:hypothetical protein